MSGAIESMSLFKKLGVLILSAVLGVCVLTALSLLTQKSSLMEERKAAVQQTVDSVHGLLTYYHGMAAKGQISESDAKKAAMSAVRPLRYGNNEYFWVNDMQSVSLMHPISPELEGKNLSGKKDPTGKAFFTEFVETVKKSGSGFVFYMWPQPGSDKPVQKVTYVKGFAPWGWIIGSGVYINSVEEDFMRQLVSSTIGAAAVGLVLLAIGLLISRSLLRQIGGEPAYAVSIASRIAAGDLTANVQTRAGDNTSLLAAIKRMNDSLANVVGQRAWRHRHDRHGLRPDRRRQPGPVAAHRGAGQLAGGDGRLDGGADRHRQAERRQRPAGQPAGHLGLGSGRQGRRGGRPGGRHHGLDQRSRPGRSPTSSA